MVELRSNDGQIAVKRWSNCGQTLVKVWINDRQIAVKRGSNRGQTRARAGSRPTTTGATASASSRASPPSRPTSRRATSPHIRVFIRVNPISESLSEPFHRGPSPGAPRPLSESSSETSSESSSETRTALQGPPSGGPDHIFPTFLSSESLSWFSSVPPPPSSESFSESLSESLRRGPPPGLNRASHRTIVRPPTCANSTEQRKCPNTRLRSPGRRGLSPSAFFGPEARSESRVAAPRLRAEAILEAIR